MKLNRIILSAIFIIALVVGCAAKNQSLEKLPRSMIQADESIDMRGKTITTYIIFYAQQTFQSLNEGDILETITNNSEAVENDIRAWSRMKGHAFLGIETAKTYERFFIIKGQKKLMGKR